jgi:protein SCO1
MSEKKGNTLLTVLAALVCLGLGIGISLYRSTSLNELKAVQLLPGTKPMERFDFAPDFKGYWSFVFFGFTSCPDFCPLELQKMGRALRNFKSENKKPKNELQVVFVSVDPERDTEEKIADYVKFFHPNILGVRASNKEIADFAHFFAASYERSVLIDNKVVKVAAGENMPATVGNDYVVNHSTRIFVVNPKGEYIGSFTPPYEADTINQDLSVLIDNFN